MIVSLVAGVFAATIGALGALAAPPANDECAGALAVTPGGAGVPTSNIEATSFPDDPVPSCTMGPGFGSVFFTFVATHTTARISTDLNSAGLDADFAVYAIDQGDQCNTGLWGEVGCSEDNATTLERNTSTCIEGLVVNNTYKIVLKSFTAGSSGDYTLQIDSPCVAGVPAVCGNGVIEGTEQCDDGNVVDGDGCSAICEIEVFNFQGFKSPVENLPTVNLVKAGQGVSLKWQIPDGSGGFISDPSIVVSFTNYSLVACPDAASISEELLEMDTSGKSGLHYDTTDEQFVFVWKTPKSLSGQCADFILGLTDGTERRARFSFK